MAVRSLKRLGVGGTDNRGRGKDYLQPGQLSGPAKAFAAPSHGKSAQQAERRGCKGKGAGMGLQPSPGAFVYVLKTFAGWPTNEQSTHTHFAHLVCEVKDLAYRDTRVSHPLLAAQ